MYHAPYLYNRPVIGYMYDQWINYYWGGPNYHVKDTGQPTAGGNSGRKYFPRFHTDANMITGFVIDSGRNWTTPYQDIIVEFNTQAADAALTPGGTATGHTIKINTVAQTTLYQSGSGSGRWTLRVPVIVHANDIITYSYDTTAGATTAVDTTTELLAVTDISINNLLTKRLHFNLFNSDNNPVTEETVKVSTYTYNSGTVDTDMMSDLWMRRTSKLTTTTSASGVVDALFYGPENAGDSIYVCVVRPDSTPTESFIWNTTVS